jgi:UDP-GlcNAc3NAcA epimerase
MNKKIITVVGARPQFIKAAPVSAALRKAGHHEILVHTGQHYDHDMSAVFFEELGMKPADHSLAVGSGPHGAQTGAMLAKIESVLQDERPDWMLVYGDTNSTLAGALAASKLHIPVAHVEAGLRSFDVRMPEEVNRKVVDHLSALLLAPGATAIANLEREGLSDGVHDVGDVMADALMHAAQAGRDNTALLDKLSLRRGGYLLVTLHRAQNTECQDALRTLLRILADRGETAVFPVHPRTAALVDAATEAGFVARMRAAGSASRGPVIFTPPLGYLDMVQLERHARAIVTDSGGVQKEAYWLRVPCVTLRPNTEWIETVEEGWNRLAPLDDAAGVAAAIDAAQPLATHRPLYGDGRAAARIAELLAS